jgi:hypothetical protein
VKTPSASDSVLPILDIHLTAPVTYIHSSEPQNDVTSSQFVCHITLHTKIQPLNKRFMGPWRRNEMLTVSEQACCNAL